MRLHLSKLFAAAALAAVASITAEAQSVTTQLSFSNPVSGIAVNPVTNRIYVVVPGGAPPSDVLTVIDGKTDTITANITVPAGAYVDAVNILTNRIYIATCAGRPLACSVTVVDGHSNQVLTSIPVTTTPGDGLLGITVDPVTGNVYVANGSDKVIDIINGYSNAITGTISLNGATPWGLAFNPLDKRLYVTFGSSEIAVIDPCKKTILSTATFGVADYNVAVNWLTGNIFVTDSEFGPSTTGVFNAKGSPLAQVPVDDTPFGVDVDPITNLAFVASSGFNNVDVIDGKTNTETSVVAGVPAFFVAVNYATAKVYVAGGETVTVMTEK